MKTDPAKTFIHTNRRGDVYFLQAKSRRSGGEGYSFARKMTGKPVQTLPEGYEVYEKPEGAQVFLRKIKTSPILPMEKRQVDQAVRKLAGLEHFIVEIESKSLVIYLADIEPDERMALMSAIVPISAAQAESMRNFMIRHARYEKMMRLTLVNAKQRSFTAERWCFKGGIDDWIYLDGDLPLADLLEKFVPHLGQESFFELM